MTSASTPPQSADSRLRADRDRFVALAFCWADTLIELDSDNTIIFAAGLTMAVTGLGPSSLMGRHIDEVLTSESQPALRRLLGLAEKCGRIDNVSIAFKGPDGGGVPVDLAVHRVADLGTQSFLAIRLGGAVGAGPGRLIPLSDDGLLDPEAFIGAAKRLLSRKQAKDGPILTLLSAPTIAALRQRLGDAAHRTLTTTIAGYLKARSIDRMSAARLVDGRYGLIHNADLDVERLESHFLSIANDFDPSSAGVGIESASIAPSVSLSEEALGQVVSYAVRQFRDSIDTSRTLQGLRGDLQRVATDAAEMAKTFAGLVETNAFHIAFQPIVSADTGDITFFEGLARIDGRDNDSPYKYICYAEETGQICKFDIAMAEKALTWIESRPEPDIRVSINLSGLSMLDPEFITRLHGVMDAHPAGGERLAFEITDCPQIDDLDAANQLIQSLRQRGHRVGLDDFLPGIAGFRILTSLDVDFVKFDRNTAANAKESDKSGAFLLSLTGFCRMLGIQTIATAVETDECLRFHRECGFECVQGYLFGKPSPDIESFRSAKAMIAKDLAG